MQAGARRVCRLPHAQTTKTSQARAAGKSHRVASTQTILRRLLSICIGAGRRAARLHLGVVTLALLELVPAPKAA
jgi:hypothetical protein